ncbi:hypothetical protein, partial [Serratia marcescens]|uniref:hypothetical protein n=1 Tax=Serratia marcescens TaxID=615 RepID=UPI0016531FAC
SAAYLLAPSGWHQFRSYLNSPAAHGVILGIMNIQSQLDVNRKNYQKSASGIPFKKKPQPVCPEFTMSRQECFRHVLTVNGGGRINFINSRRLPQKDIIDERIVVLLNALTVGTRFEIGIYGPKGGHSVAIKIQGGQIGFFDSNIGEIRYQDNPNGRSCMRGALLFLFADYYTTYDRMTIEAYT